MISALGPSLKRSATGTPLTAGTRNVVKAMEAGRLTRFIGLATPSLVDPADKPHWKHKVLPAMAGLLFPHALAELTGMTSAVTGSSLDYTIARITNPTDKPAIAQATKDIRLTSAVSVLSTTDPVRLHQDFSSLDLVSGGRAEIIVGRSAFLEAFALYGVDPADYDSVFAEKLGLLLAIRDDERVTWSGRHRPALDDLPVPPRPQQDRLPLWLGVGGTPASAERAGGLGLPMVLGLIGGDIRRARPLVEHYRTAGQAAGHPAGALKLGITSHFYVGRTSQGARDDLYPHYREYLRPKTPGGRGWLLGTDRFLGQIDFGAMPAHMVNESIELLATEVAPAIRHVFREVGVSRS